MWKSQQSYQDKQQPTGYGEERNRLQIPDSIKTHPISDEGVDLLERHDLRHHVGLSVKISRCRHLQKIIVNWLVSLLSLLRQQSLLFIDYIYFNKIKSYAWDMQAKLKERKIILENFAALRKER